MPLAGAVPAIISTAVGAGGSIASSLIGKSAAGKAADAQVAAAQRAEQIANSATTKGQELVTGAQGDANNVLSDAVQSQLAMYAPYLQAGSTAIPSLQQLAGAGGPLDQTFSFNPTDLQSDPGYQFTLQQGQQAIQRAQAARGGLFSTGTLKSLAGFTTGTANQYFNDAFNRAASTFNINRQTALSRIGTLQGLVGLGTYGTSGASQAVGSGASQIGANIFRSGEYNADLGMQGARVATGLEQSQGNARAAGTIGGANALSSGIGGVTNAVTGGINQFLTLRQLANAQPSTTPGFVPYDSARPYSPPAPTLPTISTTPVFGQPVDLSGMYP